MKKSIAFVVIAVVAAGAGYRYSRRSALLALSPVERQSLHDAPNDMNLQEQGLDSANAAPVATPPASDFTKIPFTPSKLAFEKGGGAGGTNAGNAGARQLTADELSQFKALAQYAYKHGIRDGGYFPDPNLQKDSNNPNASVWTIKTRIKKQTFSVDGEVQSDGSLNMKGFTICRHPEYNMNSFTFRLDGSLILENGNLDPQASAELEKDLSFWSGFAEAHGLGLDGLNVGE
jgi:hypothetical protein